MGGVLGLLNDLLTGAVCVASSTLKLFSGKKFMESYDDCVYQAKLRGILIISGISLAVLLCIVGCVVLFVCLLKKPKLASALMSYSPFGQANKMFSGFTAATNNMADEASHLVGSKRSYWDSDNNNNNNNNNHHRHHQDPHSDYRPQQTISRYLTISGTVVSQTANSQLYAFSADDPGKVYKLTSPWDV